MTTNIHFDAQHVLDLTSRDHVMLTPLSSLNIFECLHPAYIRHCVYSDEHNRRKKNPWPHIAYILVCGRPKINKPKVSKRYSVLEGNTCCREKKSNTWLLVHVTRPGRAAPHLSASFEHTCRVQGPCRVHLWRNTMPGSAEQPRAAVL